MTTADRLLYALVGLIAIVVVSGIVRGTIDSATVGILAGFGGILAGVLDRYRKNDPDDPAPPPAPAPPAEGG